ncbi:MAG: SUMF1/EgtB/PvdO family nonheme iron enzyme [Phycisphaerales bacterium]|nr:SUMF1/EgtB/PvdO family nonheme iron enzyme [Phycisphaerales bacterium]
MSGIDFVRIGAVGNAPYQASNPNAFVHNRGGIAYEYSIGRFEVTTAEWVPFFNAAFRLPADQRIPHIVAPSFWGAAGSPGNWTVPAGNERRPVGDISWRMAAIFCNWNHNGRGATREAFMSGAYDVESFGFESGVPNLRFTDQQAHSPGARYWIPTFDELFKASHFDPNGNGPGQARWWEYNNASDTAPVYGTPGVLVNGVLAQANAGWDSGDYPGRSPFTVPLGSYGVQSPWGLLDTAGGTTEWTETVTTSSSGTRSRVFDGSFWSHDAGQAVLLDGLRGRGEEFPHVPTFEFGVRLASSVPAPGTSAAGLCLLVLTGARRSRRPAQCTRSQESSSA